MSEITEPVFIMCDACGSIVGETHECDCTKMETGTQRLIGLYRGPAATPSSQSLAEARRLAENCVVGTPLSDKWKRILANRIALSVAKEPT